jgi:hypothetical protein
LFIFDLQLIIFFDTSRIKIGAKVVRHSRKIVFQMAEVAVPRALFQTILERIGRLRSPAAATG